MHDISDNKYLSSSTASLQEYSIQSFLHSECILAKRKDTNKIYFAIANILAVLRFNFKLIGYNYLTMLVAHYIVKHDYTEESAINKISEMCGTIPQVITDNINAVIQYNPTFLKVAVCALPKSIDITYRPTISDTVEIVGAIFKLYYNYTTDSEVFYEENNPAIDFNRIVFRSGK